MPLVQADSTSVEAVFVGYFMGDQDYMTIARKSIHAYVVAKKLGWNVTPVTFTPEMADELKVKEKDLYDQIKIAVHGSSYGMGPYLMHMTRPELYPTLKDAERVQDIIYSVLPGLPRWQHSVRVQAKNEGFLENPWGGRHYFYEVFTWKYDDEGNLVLDERTGLPKTKQGADSKRVVAYKPQSSNGNFQRDNVRIVGESAWAEFMPANLTVHDSMLLDVPEERVDDAVVFLADVMTRPIPQMQGLQVGVEVEVGDDWLNMTPVHKRPMLSADDRALKFAA